MARPKHRAMPAGTYFITAGTSERRSLFHKPDWATVVEEKIVHYRDQGSYQLHRYVIMPDHIHALITPGDVISLERAVQYIKGGSSREIGVRFQSHFPIWQPGFTEHRIRDEADYRRHVTYIDINPVRARLVTRPEEYLFGSVRGKHKMDPWPLTSGAEARHTHRACGGVETPPFHAGIRKRT
jgi:putative transposase